MIFLCENHRTVNAVTKGDDKMKNPSNKNKTKLLAVLACATLAVSVFGATSPAMAASSASEPLSADEAYSQTVQLLEDTPLDDLAEVLTQPQETTFTFSGPSPMSRSGYAQVTCTAQLDYPHKSTGAGGALAKTRISCTGTGLSTVSVRNVGGVLFRTGASGTLTERARSAYNQTITVNGGAVTYYIPQTGNGGTGNGYWFNTSSWQIQTPMGNGTVGSNTAFIFRNIQ